MGVTDVRLTGGEPLVRRDFPQLVAMLAPIEGLHDLSLTTNGYLLERMAGDLAAAGLRRINVSLDSLSRDRFFQMTRRDSLPQVLAGLEALERHPEISPIKVNCVAMRDFTEDEVLPVRRARAPQALPGPVHRVHAARRRPRVVGGPRPDRRRDARDDRRACTRSSRCRATRTRPRACTGSRDGRGEIGFVNPVSEPFCGDCNRIRLTAEGKLRTCLFSMHETDLREPLRDGADDDELEQIDPRRGVAQGAEAPRVASPASASRRAR